MYYNACECIVFPYGSLRIPHVVLSQRAVSTQVHHIFFSLFFFPILMVRFASFTAFVLFTFFGLSRSVVLTLSSLFCVCTRFNCYVIEYFYRIYGESSKYTHSACSISTVAIFLGRNEWIIIHNRTEKERKKCASEWMELREWKSNNM